jgi:FkbM family methyltransferase
MQPQAHNALQVANGWAILPSSLKRADATPRFNLTFPAFYATDIGAQVLAATELGDGYELPTRNLIERTLRQGDLFVDVGAHWGLFTLQAATHPTGDIDVVSFEPELMNAVVLSENVVANKVNEAVTVICAACGSGHDLAPLTTNSTMGHSINGVGLPENGIRGRPQWVPVVALDAALANLRKQAGRRIILKIDAEGFEPQIIAGARSLLQGGRIALIIWEWGTAFVEGRERGPVLEMLAFLGACGFRHFQPPAHHQDGQLGAFAIESAFLGNVFSFAPQLEERHGR